MPLLVWAAVAALVLPAAFAAQVALSRPGRSAVAARQNLTTGLVAPAFEAGTLEARRTGAGAVLRTVTAESSARRIRRMLETAGRPVGFTMTRLLWAKLWLPVLAAAAGALFGRGQERQEQIGRELPDVLDQMMIAVEAGLGFDAASARAATTGCGALAEELVRTQHDISAGRPRRAAYERSPPAPRSRTCGGSSVR